MEDKIIKDENKRKNSVLIIVAIKVHLLAYEQSSKHELQSSD
jgi:hypothetical protein